MYTETRRMFALSLSSSERKLIKSRATLTLIAVSQSVVGKCKKKRRRRRSNQAPASAGAFFVLFSLSQLKSIRFNWMSLLCSGIVVVRPLLSSLSLSSHCPSLSPLRQHHRAQLRSDAVFIVSKRVREGEERSRIPRVYAPPP